MFKFKETEDTNKCIYLYINTGIYDMPEKICCYNNNKIKSCVEKCLQSINRG